MNRDISSEILINRSDYFRIVLKVVSFLLFFVGSLTTVYADDYHMGLKGYSSHEGYYYGGNEFQSGEKGDRGNGATGGLAAFLLISANLTVLLSLIHKGINRLFPLTQETKDSIGAFNRSQKRYLRALHYYLNPIAICIAFIHFHLSTCRSILPDAALMLFVILGALGVIMKYRLCPGDIYKVVYRMHCSWIVFSIVVMVLTIGHATL